MPSSIEVVSTQPAVEALARVEAKVDVVAKNTVKLQSDVALVHTETKKINVYGAGDPWPSRVRWVAASLGGLVFLAYILRHKVCKK